MTEPSRAEFKYLVERQREEIRTINEVGRILASTMDPLELVRRLAAYLKQTFPVALVGVLLKDPSSLHMVQFANIAQMDIASAVRETCVAAKEMLSQALDEQTLAQTIEWDNTSKSSLSGPLGYLRSRYITALTASDKRIGLLVVSSGKPDAFSQDDQHVLDIVADQLSAALQSAYLMDELRKANQLKNDLLMVISHELRIPLTAIKEGLNLLLEQALGELNAEQKDFLATVNDNANRLEALVEKVVAATQLVTDQLLYTLKPLEIKTLIEQLQSHFTARAAAKGVKFTCAIPIPKATLQADAKRLSQAIGHVIENAIQASSAEQIVTLACSATASGIRFEVTDNGPGIPPQEMHKLFEQFRVIGGIDDRKTGGLGLGLFLAKAFLSGHGGQIHVESEPGKGTRVCMDVPLSPPKTS